MKKIGLIILAISMIAACKSKKSAASTPSGPTDAQLQAVKTKLPETSMADLNAGHAIWNNQCTNCHGKKNVTEFTEERLKKIMDKMSKKAKLDEAQTAAVWKYALALNLAK